MPVISSVETRLEHHDIHRHELGGSRTCDSVFDLDTRVDLNEIVPAHLVDQELGSAGIAVADALREFDGICKNGLTDLFGEVSSRSDFDDLLVTTLYRAVPLEEVNSVSKGVGEQLNFNVAGAFKETLNEHGTIAEGRLGFGHGTLKRGLELRLLPDNAHTTTTTTHSSLDDDYMRVFRHCQHRQRVNETRQTWETILLDERVGLGVGSDWSWSTGYNGDTNLYGYAKQHQIARTQIPSHSHGPMVRALVLSPSESITSGDGPTKARPAISTLRANSAFSDKNPYLFPCQTSSSLL